MRSGDAEPLRASDHKYPALLATAPLVVFIVDADGRFTLSEGQGLNAAGLQPGEVVGQSAYDFYGAITIHEASGTVITGREALDRVLQGGIVTGITELNGRYFENSFIPILSREGSVDGMIGVSFDVTELERSVVALRESEEHVRTVLENISDVITVLSLDGTIRYQSPSVTRVAGYAPGELVGRNAFEFIHLDDVPEVAHAFATAGGDLALRLFRFRHKNGRWLTLEGLGKAHTADDGTVTVVVASRDVGERERAMTESRLLQDVTRAVAEAKDTDAALVSVMRLACEATGFAYAEAWVPSADGTSLVASSVWHSTGIDVERVRANTEGVRIGRESELLGGAWTSRQPVWMPDVATDRGFLRREFAARAGLRTALAMPVVQGEARSVAAVVTFYSLEHRDEDPRLARLLAAVMAQLGSAMQRRQAEFALAASQKLLQSVITSAPVILFALDRAGVFTLSEGRALEAVGLRRGQVVGKSALEMYADVPEIIAQLGRALAGETFNSTADVRGQSYQTWFSPMIDASGAMTGVVGVGIDVTEQTHLQAQLQQSQKLESVGRLAGGIAHDFNNMLTAIIGYAELVMDHVPEDPEVHEEVLEIRRAADRASLLTNQLLAFSRKQILRPKTLDLNEVVTDVSRMLRRLIGEDITMVTKLGADLGAVSADPGQVTQVLMNLAVNARDAMPDGGVLTLETANVELDDDYAAAHVGVQPGPFVTLAVSDTGTGMSPAIQRRIFEPFFTTKPVGKGTGMGLASVYGIVKQSGGHVGVHSEEGHGSTFKLYLPRVAPAEPLAREPAATALPRGTETILLVEDEEMVRELVRRTLEGCGYTVLAAPDGRTALDICTQHDAAMALLITDVVMPKMSGRELATQVVASRPGIRVLFMSGYTDDAIVHHGVLDEATHFLQKPFAMRTLALKVREVLDR